MELTSKATGNMLKLFLFIGIVLSSITVITTFFYSYFYEFFISFIYKIDQAVSIFYTMIWIIILLLYLLWIYKVHKDLKKMDSNYPIKPSGALARILIPVYSLYGMWNIFSTMVDYFKGNISTVKQAKKIGGLIPYYYILLLLTNLLNRLIEKGIILNNHVVFLSYVFDTVLLVIFLVMTKSIFESLQVISAEINSDTESKGDTSPEVTEELVKEAESPS